jgi:hypothetical protein
MPICWCRVISVNGGLLHTVPLFRASPGPKLASDPESQCHLTPWMTAGAIAPTTHSVRTPLRSDSSLRRRLVPGALPERRVHRPARLVEPLGIQRLQVVFVPFEGGQPSGAAEDFLTGFIADTERGELTAGRSASRSCQTACYSSPTPPGTLSGASKPLNDDGPRAPGAQQRATSSAVTRWSRFRQVIFPGLHWAQDSPVNIHRNLCGS